LKETNMKKTLWTTTAAIALIAGTSMAFAEGGMGQGRDHQAAPAQQMNQAPAKADDKAAPKAAQDQKAAPKAAQDNKAAPKAAQGAEDKGRPQTTGQGSSQPSGSQAQQPQRQPSAGAAEDKGAQSQTQPSGQRQPSAAQQSPSGSQSSPTTGQAARPAGDSVTLSAEQKTKIRTTVLTSNAPRVTNVNFSVSVGTVVPRSVKIVAVPAPLIEIHPAWRGYMYFVVNDEIIIVEPGSLKIVAVINV